jgi:hypothetical protein
MPLQMHRQQNVLHDVLGLIDRLPCPRQTAARRGPQDRRDGPEQAMIGRIVTCNGRPHQAGPFVLTFAHTRSHTAIRSIFQFVTPRASDHEVVIEIASEIDTVARCFGIRDAELRIGRLLTSIGSADTRRINAEVFSWRTAAAQSTAHCRLPCFRPV